MKEISFDWWCFRPCCPLCNYPIKADEDTEMIRTKAYKTAAHSDCVDTVEKLCKRRKNEK